ncbi:hypothetical protein R6Q57_021191 [Mikania cordata]
MVIDSPPNLDDGADIFSPMIPNESDSMVGKRKEMGGLELEGSRRKKKKKQGGTPRPACSWVHFSREFIKEYSASHPESSGLKVATKAASDAWKVMTLEEKSKYTKRAREVWNDYLSSAPAREPKPRKQLFYYESVAIGGTCEPGPVVVPCMSLWTEEAISEREKQEKELGGYGCGEVICKERGLGLGLLSDRDHVHVLPLREVAVRVNRGSLVRQEENLENVPFAYKNENTPPGRIDSYGYKNQLEYTNTNPHDNRGMYTGQSTCPLLNCNFTGLFQELSDHFSSKHWDSGRRFQYNSPLPVSLGMDETFLVLQAEEDGVLFLLNKGTENIGHTVMITCIGPPNGGERFMYCLVSERGNSSLRLKSYTQTLPGRVEGIPQSDFLLVPFGYLNSSGELNLEVCIWSHSDLDEV